MRSVRSRAQPGVFTAGSAQAVRSLGAALAVVLLSPPATAARAPVVVLDPAHDLRTNVATEPIGPGSSVRKIDEGGGARG